MRVLVLGSTGLLGNRILNSLHTKCKVIGTARSIPEHIFFKKFKIETGVDSNNLGNIRELINDLKCDFVINCIGVIPQKKDTSHMLFTNGYFPFFVSKNCKNAKSKFIQISSDCVFKGNDGDYIETDPTSAKDLYGISKAVGETCRLEENSSDLVIRTSLIGHEFRSRKGLLEWFLSQNESVNGFAKYIWNGVTAQEFSNIIFLILSKYPNLSGVLHVGGEKMSKYDLLVKIKNAYEKNIDIKSCEMVVADKSLNCHKMKSLGINPISMHDMLLQMKDSWNTMEAIND